ncbi:MAG TPA: gamma-glutamyltransferase family protein [Chloroflexota bacterium]|nr:gamma-glutamyltransferase family protein [Chloroflexota bacterium]
MAFTFGTPVYSADGVIAAPHYLASLAGIEVLRDGGSAVDAAIAANLVLAVVWPHMCGPGGDLFAQVLSGGAAEQVHGLNGSGRAGADMTLDAYRSRGLDAMPVRGPLSVTVPGAVDGWFALHERFGRLEMPRLARDAVRYARSGYRATSFLADASGLAIARLSNLHTGERELQPELANSLEAIAREGRNAMYGGELGRRVIQHLREEGGLLREADLAAHCSEWVKPISADYRGVQVLEMPPNSQGITLLRMLQTLADCAVAAWDAAERVHRLVEVKQQAFEERDSRVADPPRGDTIYLCAADRDGMVVSLIQSLYSAWGSGVHVPGTGITLHNRGWGFRLRQGHPNALAPGKRPLHTLMPGFALRDGHPWLAFGTRGADGQPQTGLQLLTGLLDLDLDVQAAIEAPRWVHAAPGDRFPRTALVLESRFGDAVVQELRERGHEVIETEPLDTIMGTAQMIQVDSERGCYVAATDPRGDGVALAL